MAFKLFDYVLETSTTTGTSDLTLAGAVPGFSTFASRYSTGDTLYYGAQATDASGVPTGEWEVGLGTYSAANTLTRTTILSSSNSDATVSFSAGAKRVFVTMTALQGSSVREKLTAARTYYVRTDGSDSNDGLANTSGGAFLTLQKAMDVIAITLDLAGYVPTIKLADGTYTSGLTVKPLVGGNEVTIDGNSGTPANVLISTTSGPCITSSTAGVKLNVKNLKLQTTTSGVCLAVGNMGIATVYNINFGSCATHHINIIDGGRVIVLGNYAISGGATYAHIYMTNSSFECISKTITLTGTPGFPSSGFMIATLQSNAVHYGCTFSGSATGVRYSATTNSIVFTSGGGATYFPGNSAGSTSTGGQYL